MNKYVTLKPGTVSHNTYQDQIFLVSKWDDEYITLHYENLGSVATITVPVHDALIYSHKKHNTKPDICSCEICEAPTTMTGTKRCNNCWEIETRIRNMDHEILLKILHTRFSHVYLHNPVGS